MSDSDTDASGETWERDFFRALVRARAQLREAEETAMDVGPGRSAEAEMFEAFKELGDVLLGGAGSTEELLAHKRREREHEARRSIREELTDREVTDE